MPGQTNGSEVWREHIVGMLNASDAFFNEGIMYEGCEAIGKCNVDQRSFKAYFARWLAATAELAPFTHERIITKLATSAQNAIKTCTAGDSGTQCGLRWTTGANDGSLGVGEQMAALEIVQSNLIDKAPGWASAVKGTGTSVGNVNAGSSSKTNADQLAIGKTTNADRAGAGILTALMIVGVIGGSATMIMS
jgi:mannan endo-1,6-alpha-mannosidase